MGFSSVLGHWVAAQQQATLKKTGIIDWVGHSTNTVTRPTQCPLGNTLRGKVHHCVHMNQASFACTIGQVNGLSATTERGLSDYYLSDLIRDSVFVRKLDN